VLTQIELKTVLSTLTQRRAWLRKALEDQSIEEGVRKENTQNLQALESAMKKLAALPSKANGKSAKPVAPPQKKRPQPLTLATAKVLIAEDQAETAELISQILEDIGIKQIEMASDGREAFDKIRRAKEPFDFILCDWEMPELNGLEVLEKAKASNTLGDALFWMVTGNTDTDKIKQAAMKGAKDYIAKPVQPDVLEGKLKAAITALGGSA